MNKVCIIDTETNALRGYTALWVVVCRDAHTNKVTIFRNLHNDETARELLSQHLNGYGTIVGHNLLGFDLGVLDHFAVRYPRNHLDTLIVSRLLNYSLPGGHSLEAWGKYFKYPKDMFSDFTQWSQGLEDRCIVDTEITLKLYNLFRQFIESDTWKRSIALEHDSFNFSQQLGTNGFFFNIKEAQRLHDEIKPQVDALADALKTAFPPRTRLIREVLPRSTGAGTLHKGDFRWLEGCDLTPYTPGEPFSLFLYETFNPNSSTQRVERLNEAGWKPFNKTKAHIQAERDKEADKLKHYKIWGWKTDEENLATLPDSAPEAAKMLARYLLLVSRLRNLTEWIGLYNPATGRIHGHFNSLGAWTGRMSHDHPNLANIPALRSRTGAVQLYGAEFRALFCVPEGKVLVGCDADGIQLRLFAHFTNDEKLIASIVSGNKEEKTDIHSLNKEILGTICNSREAAKTYIYALLLGAGKDKQANILGCTAHEAIEGLKRILEYYPGWKILKDTTLKQDAKKGYFKGIDGRLVMFPSAHYILAGYLQNGESVVMKMASILWHRQLTEMGIPHLPVNFVHDEWQVETLPEYADTVGKVMADSIRIVGEQLQLNCPLAGSYVVGQNWKDTH